MPFDKAGAAAAAVVVELELVAGIASEEARTGCIGCTWKLPSTSLPVTASSRRACEASSLMDGNQ